MNSDRQQRDHPLRQLRVVSQVAVLAAFLYLVVDTGPFGDRAGSAVRLFFHVDPLLAMTVTVAGRALAAAFLLALVTLAVTAVIGRHVCGWACPLGTVHQACSALFRRLGWLRARRAGDGALIWKYVVLAIVIIASLLAIDLAGWVDPMSFLYRACVTSMLPAAGLTVQATTDAARQLGAHAVSDAVAGWTRVLALDARFQQSLLVGGLFLVALVLNARQERFWCRYLCPTGALLAVAGRWPRLRLSVDEQRCHDCGACARRCETGASPGSNATWRPGECVYCYTCVAVCPTRAISLTWGGRRSRPTPLDPTRRRILLAPAVGLLALPLVRLSEAATPQQDPIRPPGSLPEPEFLARCVKCGACLRVCPTNGLQPASAEAGLDGLWTPVLTPRRGGCDQACTRCLDVCPTGAIQPLALEVKRRVRIGSAWIDRDRCLPYALGRRCHVCEAICPTSPKAIAMHPVDALLPNGEVVTVRAPVVDLDLCTGCGLCEMRCPVAGSSAIVCTSAGEERQVRAGAVVPGPD